MVIKTNMQNGMEPGSSALDAVRVNIEGVSTNDYYEHPKLADDFLDLRTTVSGITDFGTEMGARNYLFSGPPGTGKTLAAKVLSAELGIPMYDISGLVKGQSQNVAQVFDELRRTAESSQKGVFAFIDEVEGLSSRDNIVDPLQYQALTQFLSQMEGVTGNHGVFIIGTTNRPNDLDEAIRSRFSEEIEFLPPDKAGRYAILKIHADGKGGHAFKTADSDLDALALKTYGYVGRDLRQVLNRAFTHAKREQRTDVNAADLEYGLKKTKPSAIRDMPFVEPKIRLDDVKGYDAHKELLGSVVRRSNESVILLYGPKGTGKTFIVEALAGEFGYNLILVKGSELENKYVGNTKDNTERVIKRAKQLSPCIVCFDEISSFIERSGTLTHKDSQTGYLQSVLSRPPEGVYIIATDNNPQFLRGPFVDRFIHKLYFGMPSEDEQRELWRKYAPDVDNDAMVAANPNLSCRAIAHACRKAVEYGASLSVETLSRLSQSIPRENIDAYKEIVPLIGDDVANYRALMQKNE